MLILNHESREEFFALASKTRDDEGKAVGQLQAILWWDIATSPNLW
jgi:hypothetical protein